MDLRFTNNIVFPNVAALIESLGLMIPFIFTTNVILEEILIRGLDWDDKTAIKLLFNLIRPV